MEENELRNFEVNGRTMSRESSTRSRTFQDSPKILRTPHIRPTEDVTAFPFGSPVHQTSPTTTKRVAASPSPGLTSSEHQSSHVPARDGIPSPEIVRSSANNQQQLVFTPLPPSYEMTNAPDVEVTHYPILPNQNAGPTDPQNNLQNAPFILQQPYPFAKPPPPSSALPGCQCACHHTHHHHHHHTIYINGQPLADMQNSSTSSGTSTTDPIGGKTTVLKTASCPPWADGAPKGDRPIRKPIRNFNMNCNVMGEETINEQDAPTVCVSVNNSNNNDVENPINLGRSNNENRLPGCHYRGPVTRGKKVCCRITPGMAGLLAMLVIVILSLLGGLIYFLVRGHTEVTDSPSSPEAANSVPEVSIRLNQTSVCGYYPLEYLPISVRSMDVKKHPVNPHPPENDSRINNARIIGGMPANVLQYPWQVSLWVDHRGMTCGGSIIMRDWVLTAAHCTESNSDPAIWTAYVGMSLISTKSEPPAQSSKIDVIIQHEKYVNNFSYDYDVSLMKLTTPLTYTPNVQPICLPSATDEFRDGTACWISGWGAMSDSGQGGQPNLLQSAEVDIIGYETCRRDDWLGELVSDRMLCAGKADGSRDACQGDSGGPLSCYDPKKKAWTLAGSVSWGIDCGGEKQPGVYAKIPFFVDWIWTNIGIAEGWIEAEQPTEPDKITLTDALSFDFDGSGDIAI